MYVRLMISVLLGLAAAQKQDFTGYKVLSVPVANDQQTNAVLQLSKFQVDFWALPTTKAPADVVVPPTVFSNVTNILDKLKIAYTYKIENLQDVIDEESGENKFARLQQASSFRSGLYNFDQIFSYYASYNEIQSWLQNVARTYSSIASLENIGNTHEGRNLIVLKVSNGGGNTKPVIWIDGGIHAREWIATSTTLYLLWQLVSGYGTGATRQLVNKYDWYFLPQANPDGYVHTHQSHRLWRKNRRPSGYQNCFGVDPNRNFNFHWAEPGTMSSPDPCSDIYHGPYAGSEYEPFFMQKYLSKFRGRLQVYLSLHCYAQMWFVPYGYTTENLPDNAEALRVARRTRDAVFDVYRRWYEVGKPGVLMYPAGGGSYDWAKGVAGAKYSYTIELRPTQREMNNGFILPPSAIRPTGQEIWAGVLKMVEVMKA